MVSSTDEIRWRGVVWTAWWDCHATLDLLMMTMIIWHNARCARSQSHVVTRCVDCDCVGPHVPRVLSRLAAGLCRHRVLILNGRSASDRLMALKVVTEPVYVLVQPHLDVCWRQCTFCLLASMYLLSFPSACTQFTTVHTDTAYQSCTMTSNGRLCYGTNHHQMWQPLLIKRWVHIRIYGSHLWHRWLFIFMHRIMCGIMRIVPYFLSKWPNRRINWVLQKSPSVVDIDIYSMCAWLNYVCSWLFHRLPICLHESNRHTRNFGAFCKTGTRSMWVTCRIGVISSYLQSIQETFREAHRCNVVNVSVNLYSASISAKPGTS